MQRRMKKRKLKSSHNCDKKRQCRALHKEQQNRDEQNESNKTNPSNSSAHILIDDNLKHNRSNEEPVKNSSLGNRKRLCGQVAQRSSSFIQTTQKKIDADDDSITVLAVRPPDSALREHPRASASAVVGRPTYTLNSSLYKTTQSSSKSSIGSSNRFFEPARMPTSRCNMARQSSLTSEHITTTSVHAPIQHLWGPVVPSNKTRRLLTEAPILSTHNQHEVRRTHPSYCPPAAYIWSKEGTTPTFVRSPLKSTTQWYNSAQHLRDKTNDQTFSSQGSRGPVPGNQTIQCSYCNKEFSSHQAMKDHMHHHPGNVFNTYMNTKSRIKSTSEFI